MATNKNSTEAGINSIYSANSINWQVDGRLILNRLSFEINPREFVGIIGPNGSGKSSLLRCLYGKNQITGGNLTYAGKPLAHYSRRELAQKIAVVVQEPPTQFDLVVSDVVAMGLIPHRSLLSFSDKADKLVVRQAIEKVELLEKINAHFNTLSGGEKQRVMVARALVQNPQVLILDEPTNHLDIQHQIEVLRLAKQMSITVLLSLHDLNMAAAFCDRLILLDQGQILSQGTCEQVLTEDNLQRLFGATAQVDDHPFHKGKRITYNFHPQDKQADTAENV